VAVGTSYVVRIEGLNLLVPKDGVKNLVIKFDVTLPVGVATTTTITYAIAGNALRGIDGAGLAQYAPLVTLGNRTLLIARSTVATLEVSAAADNPLARAVIVSETNTTEDVELLRANVKAKFNDAVIRTVIVDFVDANYRLGALKLYDGSTLLAATTTEIGSGAATTTPTASTTFSNLSLRVSKDTTKTLIVKGDILATSTGGYAASVSLPVAATAIIAEDAGDYTTVTTFTGSKAIGNGAYFYPVAPTLALASTEITGITAPSGSPTPQQAQAKIKVNVTANGADIYVPKYGTVASSGIVASSTRTLVYTFTSNATEKTASWLVPAGETKWFEVTAVLDGTSTAGFTNLYLVNFKWGTTEATAATPANTWTWGLTSFKTSDIYLQIKS